MSENEEYFCDYCKESFDYELWNSSNHGFLCEGCKENLYSYCEHCRNWVDNEEFYGEVEYRQHSHYEICNDCLDSDFSICEDCETVVSNEVIEDGYCRECWSSHFVICEYCDRTENIEDYYTVEDDVLCRRCFEDETTFCEECDTNFYSSHFNDTYYHPCAGSSGRINYYSYKPSPIFHKHNSDAAEENVYYGLELEVECSRNKGDAIEAIERDFIYMKSDGSLNDGFEVVSHPATLKYHIETSTWDEICSGLAKHGAKSHDTTTCGLHVHISRDGFYSDKHIKKFLLFWYSQNNIIKSIARRDYGHYCQSKQIKNSRHPIPSDYVLRSETRYEQINLGNSQTIEVRRFKGTLNVKTLKACIELCDASRVFCDKLSYKVLNDDAQTESEFITFVFTHKRKYPNLFEKLRSKMQIKFEHQSE